jgi:phage shock protein B
VTIAIEGVVILILAGTAALVIALAVKAVRGLRQAGSREEDARLIQEVYQGLDRLERRIESLETILSERRRGDRNE